MFTQVQIGPERSDDIPDEAAVRLVIVHPQFRHARGNFDSPAGHFASTAAQGRGTAHRLNRNMLVFLAADAKRYEELDDAVRQYLAWMELAGTEERIRELELPPQQAAQARKRLAEAKTTVDLRISATYHWLLVPVQTTTSPLRIDELKADTNRDRLAQRASERLKNADMLRIVQGPQNIRLNLDQHLSSVWSSGHIAVGKLWEYYCQYPYLPRLADRSVLEKGILAVFNQAIWDQDGFAVASGYDKPSGQYTGLRIPNEDPPPQISDMTLLVRPDRAIAQRERERAEQEAARATAAAAASAAAGTGTVDTASGGTDTDAGTSAGPSGGVPVRGSGSMPGPFTASGSTPPAGSGPAAPPAPRNTRFFGTVRLDPERYGRDINRLYQEVIQHLAAPEGVDLEIIVEITASKKDGFPDDKTRIVSENARTLKFEQFGFEDR
jgi:hypothetical protein